jgi:glycosyltransferase involved in cell wall biosynthesis
VRVVLYARPSASRNAFGLGLATLRRLKERYGDRVELLAAGEAWEPAHYGVPDGVMRNLGLLPGLDAVAELYRSCHVGLFFMMTPHASYQPLELMASGAACVSNENATTGWLLEHERTALLAPPLPALVAEQVGRLVDDPELRARVAAGGRARVAALPPWDAEIERVWRALTKSP